MWVDAVNWEQTDLGDLALGLPVCSSVSCRKGPGKGWSLRRCMEVFLYLEGVCVYVPWAF